MERLLELVRRFNTLGSIHPKDALDAEFQIAEMTKAKSEIDAILDAAPGRGS